MKVTEQDKFFNEILNDLKESISAKIEKFPENWDGHEIRQFIADYYSQHYLIGTALTGKRKKAYKNTCLVSNLI